MNIELEAFDKLLQTTGFAVHALPGALLAIPPGFLGIGFTTRKEGDDSEWAGASGVRWSFIEKPDKTLLDNVNSMVSSWPTLGSTSTFYQKLLDKLDVLVGCDGEDNEDDEEATGTT